MVVSLTYLSSDIPHYLILAGMVIRSWVLMDFDLAESKLTSVLELEGHQ